MELFKENIIQNCKQTLDSLRKEKGQTLSSLPSTEDKQQHKNQDTEEDKQISSLPAGPEAAQTQSRTDHRAHMDAEGGRDLPALQSALQNNAKVDQQSKPDACSEERRDLRALPSKAQAPVIQKEVNAVLDTPQNQIARVQQAQTDTGQVCHRDLPALLNTTPEVQRDTRPRLAANRQSPQALQDRAPPNPRGETVSKALVLAIPSRSRHDMGPYNNKRDGLTTRTSETDLTEKATTEDHPSITTEASDSIACLHCSKKITPDSHECDTCGSWIHFTCETALNPNRKEDGQPYICRSCTHLDQPSLEDLNMNKSGKQPTTQRGNTPRYQIPQKRTLQSTDNTKGREEELPHTKPKRSKTNLEAEIAESKARITILEEQNKDYINTINLLAMKLENIQTNTYQKAYNNAENCQSMHNDKTDITHRLDLLETRLESKIETSNLQLQLKILETQKEICMLKKPEAPNYTHMPYAHQPQYQVPPPPAYPHIHQPQYFLPQPPGQPIFIGANQIPVPNPGFPRAAVIRHPQSQPSHVMHYGQPGRLNPASQHGGRQQASVITRNGEGTQSFRNHTSKTARTSQIDLTIEDDQNNINEENNASAEAEAKPSQSPVIPQSTGGEPRHVSHTTKNKESSNDTQTTDDNSNENHGPERFLGQGRATETSDRNNSQ